MAKDIIKNVRICGIACCVPENVYKSDCLVDEFGKDETEAFKKESGIIQKHCCSKEHIVTAGDLCCSAAERLIQELGIVKESIDAVVFISQSPDYFRPPTACVLQHRLSLSTECIAYDINIGGTGYPYGLHLAGTYMRSGNLKRVLVLSGDAFVYTTWVSGRFFGEAGSATILEYDESAPDMMFYFKSFGDRFRDIITPYGRARNDIDPKFTEGTPIEECTGNIVDEAGFTEFLIKEMPPFMADFNSFTGLNGNMYDLAVCHQENLAILNKMRDTMSLDSDKFAVSLDIYGNTGAASMPLSICDHYNRRDVNLAGNKTQKILLCGYGAGLSLAAAGINVEYDKCFSVTTTKTGFSDGFEKELGIG